MRIKSLFIVLTLTASTLSFSSAWAIQGGTSALGNQYVVPINIEVSPGFAGSCSGAVITSRVVATAGHCVLDSSGLISKNILVGQPGSLNKPVPYWTSVSKVLVDETYKGTSSSGIKGVSDIALLVLEIPLTNVPKVDFASDALFTSLKQSSAILRTIGYGYTSDSGERTEEPKYLDTTLTSTLTADPNTTILSSTSGAVCKGDSGAPVLSVTPTKVTLVGILIGGSLSTNCTRKESDGKYLLFMTNLSRFSNLVASAISVSADIAQEENQASLDAEEQRRKELQVELDVAAQELKDLILAIKQAGLKTMKCSSKSATKTVVAKSPTCPKGFKKV